MSETNNGTGRSLECKVSYAEYKDMFKDVIDLSRDDNGVLTLRMHNNGGPAVWTHPLHKGLGQILKFIGADRDNNVLIITGTGDDWIGPIDPEYQKFMIKSAATDITSYMQTTYDDWFTDGTQLLCNLLNDVRIPTIGVVNGPTQSGHCEIAQACDLTICSEDAVFYEDHYRLGLAPGDGQYLALEHLIGTKRANYAAYTAQRIDAQKALEWGMVNEIVPKAKIMDRAYELASIIMKNDFYTRRLTHEIMVLPWKKKVEETFTTQFALQAWAGCLNSERVAGQLSAMMKMLEAAESKKDQGESV